LGRKSGPKGSFPDWERFRTNRREACKVPWFSRSKKETEGQEKKGGGRNLIKRFVQFQVGRTRTLLHDVCRKESGGTPQPGPGFKLVRKQ